MPFKRNTRRSYSKPFRRRFGGGLRKSQTLQKWIAADFFVAITSDHPSGSATVQLNLIHLASVGLSYWGDATQSALDRRAIDIGGIVFDYGIEFPSVAGDADDVTNTVDITPLENMSAFYNIGLCYDRMHLESGIGPIPDCIQTWEPFTSDFPIGTSTPDIDQSAISRPARVLWNKTHYKNFAMQLVLNNEGSDLYVPPLQSVQTRTGTVNRRLRLRLDQNHGLYLYCATLNEGNFAVDARALFRTVWFKGTLYWKPSR